jgi:transposase
VKRLVRAVREEGAAGLTSKRRCGPSNRRIGENEKAYCIELVRERYADFGPTLAAEYLASKHGYPYSVETLRGWMAEAGLWMPKKAGRARAHPPRERRPRLGELIQIDGSPHDWFEGRAPKCCLIAFIDDATSRLMRARFVPVESTRAYLAVLKDYVTGFGIPVAVYSDRHSIFTKHDPEDLEPTQFERALGALGTEPIQANSPQAKGRVERVFQTLQDRLVKAMRLAGINGIEAANIFLETWLPKHNARFAVSPRDTEDAHQPWTGGEEALCRICALHHDRTLSKDLVLTFRGQRYIVQTHDGSPRYNLRKTRVTVHEHLDNRIELLNGAEPLPFRLFDEQKDRLPPACDKSLNERVDQAVSRRNTKQTKPARNHPWRRYPEATTWRA